MTLSMNRKTRRTIEKMKRERPKLVYVTSYTQLSPEDKIMAASESQSIKSEVDTSFNDRDTIVKEYSNEVRQAIKDILIASLRTPAFRDMLADTMRESAREIAREILAEESTELESRVRAIVKDRWETEVVAAAHAYMQSKLDEVKRKL